MMDFIKRFIPIFLLLAQVYCEDVPPSSKERVNRHIEINPNYFISWNMNDSNGEIIFNITASNTGPNSYIGFGISINGAMNGADMAILKMQSNGLLAIEDRHGVGNVEPKLDTNSPNSWRLLSGWINESWVQASISRSLTTNEDDDEDLSITVDTLRLIWALGQFDPVSGRLNYHDTNHRGIISVNFLDPDVETPTSEELEGRYEVWKTEKTVEVSTNDTVYMCSFFKGPNVTRKHHMIGFGMYIDAPENRRHLHHADLYRCAAPPGVDPDVFFAPYLGDGYDCNYSPIPFPYDNCGTFEFQWTIGGKITLFPDNLGLPLGRDDGRIEYFMTEVHFDNPQKRSDLKIRAGFNIYHTPTLRPTEIGQLQLGFMTNKTYSLTVPPNSSNFVVSSHCPMDCTMNLPPEGIQVFTYLLHSHLSGRKLKLRQWRGGQELPPLAKDDHFDFNYQNNRRLRSPARILPGDHLTIECTYDTTWKKGGSTLGGRSAKEEMCQGFLLYYPRLDEVNSCGSYHKQSEILDFMGIQEVYQYQGEIDATILKPGHLAGIKYSEVVEKRMNWTTEVRSNYQKLVQFGEQRAYCIPIEGKNEAFVMTNYPGTKETESGSGFLHSSSDLVIFIAVSIVVGVAVLSAVFYIWRAMKRSRKSGSVAEIVK